MSLKFLLFLLGGMVAATFAISGFLGMLPHEISGSPFVMAELVVVAFVFGWLACVVYDVYIEPLIVEPLQRRRNRKIALEELGLDYLIDDNEDSPIR